MTTVSSGKLHMRTVRHFADLAQEIAHLLWNDLTRDREVTGLDPHRFPGLARTLNDVLLRYIGDCEACPDPARCDPWARTGGGAPTGVERSPVCDEHAQCLLKEAGRELQQLLFDLEKQTYRFLSRNNPVRAAYSPALIEKIHRTIQKGVLPHLIKNIASSCCDECARFSKISQGGSEPCGQKLSF